ncbi:protein kinase domain-containing protein [Ferrimonas pelagia]|uniref:Protein kinase domain-containing protein n=1 Tax=Ferrimonas pelagia TaxID=1177826 RepID=A0ABP9EW23_9GAMM
MELHFKSISGKDNVGDFTWIHRTGRQAIIADMVSGTDVGRGLTLLKSWLEECQKPEVFDPKALIGSVHAMFQEESLQATLGVVTRTHQGYECHVVGNLRLFQVAGGLECYPGTQVESQPLSVVGQNQAPVINQLTMTPHDSTLFMLTSDGLDSQVLCESDASYSSLIAGNQYRQFLPAVADRDWSALLFPMGEAHSFIRDEWPYNPFVGPQEERMHERRGLAELATELFKYEQFNGFRILSCPPILSDNASRLFDGLIIYPFGVLPVELKDHHGDIKIEMATSQRNSMWVANDRGEHCFSNPVHKLRESIRRFGDHPAFKGLDPMLKNAGLVVFTSPYAKVQCGYQGQLTPAPFYQAGEVMVAHTEHLGQMLLGFCKGRFGKKLKHRLDESEINRIVSQLIDIAPASGGDRIVIGDYQCSQTPIASESTDYYQIYDAWEDEHHLWAKRFMIDHLSRVHRQAEIQSLGREAQILKRLARKSIDGVQHFDGKEETDDNLYIFLQAAPSVSLKAWMETSRTRGERIKLLLSLAQILKGIQSVGEPMIIHRAINPNNIRIDEAGNPLLINFELCQLETVATLPLNARRTFAASYQAPEVNEPGQSLSYSADIFSLGVLAVELLRGSLPFKESAKELIAKGRRRAFWGGLCQDMGIATSHAEFLQRVLHNVARHRPAIDDVIKVIGSWND